MRGDSDRIALHQWLVSLRLNPYYLLSKSLSKSHLSHGFSGGRSEFVGGF